MFSVAGLEFSFHRLGRAGWLPDTVMRSWAEVPWQPLEDGVAVACLPSEVIWLGLTNIASPATVTLTASEGRASRSLLVPPDWQLAWLLDGEGRAEPIALNNASSITYRLNLQRTNKGGFNSFDLALLSPTAWTAHFEPLDLTPAESPPPVLRYSRVVRPAGLPLEGDA